VAPFYLFHVDKMRRIKVEPGEVFERFRKKDPVL
jgi:hypothetical protein